MCWRSSIAAMPKGWGSPQPLRSPIVMFSSFMVPESAATPATGKIRVVGDFAGGLPLAVVLGARLRDNGGWFWNPNAAAIIPVGRKNYAPVGAVEMKNRPGGRCFLPRSCKKQCLDEFGRKTRQPLVIRLQGESVAVAPSGPGAIPNRQPPSRIQLVYLPSVILFLHVWHTWGSDYQFFAASM